MGSPVFEPGSVVTYLSFTRQVKQIVIYVTNMNAALEETGSTLSCANTSINSITKR